MFDAPAFGLALVAMSVLAILGWALSVRLRNVAIVDVLWSQFFLLGLLVYAHFGNLPAPGARGVLILSLVAIWAVRLSAFLAWRAHGRPEDLRYAEIRQRNEPGFAFKSLYLVFLLQAVLAWIIGVPLAAAYSDTSPLAPLDHIGLVLWCTGFAFETIADWQLARFKGDPANQGQVLDSGLWRYTRHPNYFGEACLWWGFWVIAAGGAWWTIFAPVLMTLLLLKVSGVALLEKDIAKRRPAYRDYIESTNAFIPGPPRPRKPS